MPLHFPLLKVEWNLQRKRYVPALLNVKDVEPPLKIFVFFDQLLEVEVTGWVPVTSFHVTLAPLATETCFGIHL
jgi:hypothetical protein